MVTNGAFRSWRVWPKKILFGASALLLSVGGFAVLTPTSVAGAATDLVTNCNDSGPGSLRATIASAAAGDTVEFSLSCPTIELSTGYLDIPRTITIRGPGADTLEVNGAGASSVFIVDASGTATITGLTIDDGNNSFGGGVFNVGTTTLIGDTISGNNSTFEGGGVYNSGSLLMIDNTVSGNSSGPGDGGGVFNRGGELTVSGGSETGNSSEDGGGIASSNGPVTIHNNSITGNTALSAGGGAGGGIDCLGSLGSLTLTDSTVSGNSASDGAGVANDGCTSLLADDTVAQNLAGFYGAGIENGGKLTLTDSTVSGNMTEPAGIGDGGGLDSSGTATVTDSNVSGNTAYHDGGGIFDLGGGLTLTDSTVSGNTTALYGGGVFGGAGSVLVGDTVAGNAAAGDGDGVFNNTMFHGRETSLLGTIVSGSGGSACGGGLIADLGFNIDNDGSCGMAAPGSISDSAQLDGSLGALADNGGTTLSMLPTSGSPVIGAIPNSTVVNGVGLCPSTDQRGAISSPGAACDIGAIQVSGSEPTLLTVTAPSAALPYGQSLPDLTPTYAGFDGGQDPTTLGSEATCAPNRAVTAPGTYLVSCSGANNGPATNYHFEYVDGILTVGKADTQTTIASTTSNPLVGQPINVSVSVAPSVPSSGSPTGTVTVTDGTQTCTTGALDGSGTGSCQITEEMAGPTTLNATYNGDANFNPSTTTDGTSLSVQQLASTTSVVASPVPSAPGPVSYAVSVSGAGASIPTGSVTISDGQGGSCLVAALSAGSGACAVTENASDSPYAVTASYSGDNVYSASAATITSTSAVSVGGMATTGSDQVTVAGSGGTDGTDTVTESQYGTDPVGTLTDGSNYFDVAVSPASTFSNLTIMDCNDVSAGTVLQWWDPAGNGGLGAWRPVVGDPGPTLGSESPPCESATLDTTTSPTISQLTGTVFATTTPVGFAIATPSLPPGTRGQPYGPVTLTTIGGGAGAALKWMKVTLPSGLRLAKTGVLSGTLNKGLTGGPTTVSVQVTETVTAMSGKKMIKTTTTARASIPLTIVQPAPTLTSLHKDEGPAAGGTKVSIKGTGFLGTSVVKFGTVGATSFTVNGAGTTITAVTPAESAGPVDVSVTTPGGTSPTNSTDVFTFGP